MNCFAFAICSSNKKLFSVLYFLRGGYVAAQQQERGCARLMIYSSQAPKSVARRRNVTRAAVPGWHLRRLFSRGPCVAAPLLHKDKLSRANLALVYGWKARI
ncbi:hypothetical protein TorRG33x02_211500 [Trema orientale]|uniref:Uncharacterized protein n=1 Tax=Trema orientale TaxID=63057 RepID=A0A2P5EBW6_TREOI|nr:hypothetical protein TorRG33x02_211500 [Trema orientale]